MNINTTYTKIITDEDLMETVQHGSNLYPFQFYYEDLSVFDFNCVEWHWHTELEFIYIESGTVTLWIGEDQFNLTDICSNIKFIYSLCEAIFSLKSPHSQFCIYAFFYCPLRQSDLSEIYSADHFLPIAISHIS